jgi:prepilin-type N-terminal cleavage/methylation domain-containing protein
MKVIKFKVHGFTIAELCIAMVLSGILVSMAYLAYSYINQQYLRFNHTSNQISEAYRCIGIMEDQFWKADSVYYNQDTLILFSKDNKLSSFYSVTDQYVFSRPGLVDTFHITLKSVTSEFAEQSSVYGRIKNCQCTFMIEHETVTFQFKSK